MADDFFSRDVSATIPELEKWIAAAYPSAERIHETSFRIDDGAARLELVATPGPPRRIALLVLPTLRLDYRFLDGDAAARKALLHRLDLFMHRGGG